MAGRRVTRLSGFALGRTTFGEVLPLDVETSFPPLARPNWRVNTTISHEWRTEIVRATKTGLEERYGRRMRPLRTVAAQISGLRAEQANKAVLAALVAGKIRGTMPLYPDRTKVASLVSAGSTIVECETDYRRIYEGQRVAFVPGDYGTITFSGIDGQAMYGLVDYVQSDRIVLKTGVEVDVPAGSWVYPMMDCHQTFRTPIDLFSDDVVDLRLSFREISGGSTLPPSWEGSPSPWFPINDDGRAIYHLRPNNAAAIPKLEVVRDGRMIRTPTAEVAAPIGERPRFKIGFGDIATSRERAWQVLRFFDTHLGRVETFWLLNPVRLWSAPFGLTDLGYVDILPFGYFSNVVPYLPYVGIELMDGTYLVRKVESATETTVNGTKVFRLTFDTNLPGSASPLRRITAAHLVRFSGDSLAQSWTTDEVCTTRLSFVELLDERDVAITHLES